MNDWQTRLDARIDRCACGGWQWDRRCPICDETTVIQLSTGRVDSVLSQTEPDAKTAQRP